MVEMGVVPGLLSLIVLYILARFLWRRRDVTPEPIDFVALFGVVVWWMGFMVGAYRGLLFEWLYYPAGFAIYLRSRSIEGLRQSAEVPV